MKLTDKEINAVIAQPSDVRYDYSLNRIADNDSLWCLSSGEDGYMFIQEKGVNLFPIWPFEEYANQYLLTLGFEKDCRCVEIDIEKFSNEIVDYLCNNGINVCLFPISHIDYGKIVSVNTFAEDLSVEPENYILHMTNKELFQLAIEQLKTEPFLNGFKFRKRDSSFIQQEGDLRRHIELDHWNKEGVLIVYPIYMVRFDILLKWFEPYNVKLPQTRQDNPSIGFTGNMLGRQDKFRITESTFEQDYTTLRDSLSECSDMVFSSYSSLREMYDRVIIPILEGMRALPDVGADWAFKYLTLTRIVSPKDYAAVKALVLAQVHKMADRHEPNIMDYISRLDEIINVMEQQYPVV